MEEEPDFPWPQPSPSSAAVMSGAIGLPGYAELRCKSNFSFLQGASKPEELVQRAHEMGYSALAITDECSLAGVVRAHVQAKTTPSLQLLIGSEFQVDCATPFKLTVLACNLNGYGNLSEFITGLRRNADKGTYQLFQSAVRGADLADCVVLVTPERSLSPAELLKLGRWTLSEFTGRCWLAVTLLRQMDDELWLHKLTELSVATAIPLVAAGDVLMHIRSRKPLQDVMTATRIGKPLTECGFALQPNAERHLRTRLRVAQTYPPALLEETLRVAARCTFSLNELRYQYPEEVVPEGETPASYLRRVTYEGAGRRWPGGIIERVQQQIEYELELICDLQ